MKQTKETQVSSDESYLSVRDFLVSGESFQLIPNKEYGYLETVPQPSPSEIGKYYQSDAYVSHTDSKKGPVNFLYQIVKKYNLSRKTNLIKKENSGIGKLLDVGAGTGDFLVEAKKCGWQVQGVEVNPEARNRAQEKGLELYTDLNEVQGQDFDVITLWHVLEHLHDLEEQINTLAKLLKKGGSLIIAVPNYKSYDANYYGSFWAAYDVPRHLWHFSRESIIKLFSSKFQLQKIRPMVFDAFYVSLLSEKYKYGKTFSLRAFWIGLKSNWKAKSTKEYSSLIYCLRKQK